MRSLIVFCSLAVLLFAVGCSSSSRGGGGDSGTISDEELLLENERWRDGNIPTAAGSGFFDDVFFGYDSAQVDMQYENALKVNAEYLKGDPSLNVEIEGHCDKRGTSEYNLALGEERARAVAQTLVNHGVPRSRIATISYGEEIPLAPGNTETAFSKNRRAHFAVYRQQKQ